MQVVNETLRLGNVVRFLHRKALKDVRYKGTTLKDMDTYSSNIRILFHAVERSKSLYHIEKCCFCVGN